MGTDAGSVSFSSSTKGQLGSSSGFLCFVAEEALRLVSRRLPESLEPRYIDFLLKYLRACLREISISEKTRKIVFQDDRRHIYYYGVYRKALVEKIAFSAAKVTLSVFRKKPKKAKKVLKIT